MTPEVGMPGRWEREQMMGQQQNKQMSKENKIASDEH